jgi:hypothetical protein
MGLNPSEFLHTIFYIFPINSLLSSIPVIVNCGSPIDQHIKLITLTHEDENKMRLVKSLSTAYFYR